ncbi:MAG: DUF929 family protein [Nitrososphaerales archaeon]
MPKCPKCGKKFSTLQALNDHFRSIHPNEKFAPPKQVTSARTLIVIIVIVIIVMGSLVGYLIYVQLNTSTTTTTPPCNNCIGQAIPSALLQNLTGVSSSTLSTIGSGQGVTKPTAISGTPLTNNGKPEVLYIGAEFCPYCAAERWAMIVALSKFGTFSNLSLMLSSATDIYPDTSTFSFVNSSYASPYLSFVSVEYEDRNQKPLQTITSAESALQNQYDSGGSIPFVDIGNSYSVVGSQFQPYALRVGDNPNGLTAPYNWTQIGSQIGNTSSVIAQSIDGSANSLISAICSITGGNPSSVCTQSYAKISLAISPLSGPQASPIISVIRPIKAAAPVFSLIYSTR